MKITDTEIFDYVVAHTTKQPTLLDELIVETKEKFPEGQQMLSGPLEGRLLNFLVAMMHAKRVLEIGTFTGFSALSMAEALPNDGVVITCDIDERVHNIAKQFASRSPHGYKIDFRLGKALDILKTLAEPFDFIFIDADKMAYPAYFDATLNLLTSNGVIAIDNTLWEGQVLMPSEDKQTKMFIEFNNKLANDPRVQVVQLPIRDGITLVRKM